MLARVGDLAYRRRGLVIATWLAALAIVVAFVPRVAGGFDADYSTPGSDSEAASRLLAAHFRGGSGEYVNVVWEAPRGARAAAPAVGRFLERARRVEGIGAASVPRYAPNGTIGLVRLELTRPAWAVPVASGRRLIELAEDASDEDVRIELGGGVIRNAEGGASPELAGLIAAALVLLVAFGSVVAAGLPLLVAGFALGISATLIGALAALVDVPEWAPAVAGLIGIGVGIDYALLILTRFRSTLLTGRDVRDALVEAVTTAGRSALVAGGTVVVSLLGLFFIGVSYLRGVALAAGLAVVVVMAASVTLLPAVLAVVGRRVDRLRLPGLGRSLRADDATVSARWSRAVQARPRATAVAAAAALLALAAPIVGVRFGFPDEGNSPSETTTRKAYDLIAQGFGPGANGPLIAVAKLPIPLDALAQRIRQEPGVAHVAEPRVSRDRRIAALGIIPAHPPQDARTTDLVHRLRDRVIAATVGDQRVYLGGVTAAFVDQSDYVTERLPIFVAAVLTLSFVLLLAAFRAPLIALKAGVMNLLSISAAYGVVALASEGGRFGGLVGVATDTPIPPFLPVMMFAILFGLSMDYEVFLLSRVREEYLRTGQTSTAVASGLAKTASVITAAAAIMVVVFLAFMFSNEVFLKMMGVGMATAILVDATLVRMVLVPAVMQLMGGVNWWIPGWLDRILPRLDVAGERTPS